MKNNILNLIVAICTINIYHAQNTNYVGINTTTPTRTLDIEGNLTIRQTTDKKDDATYNRVLATNANGEIEYIDKEEIKNKMLDGIRESTLLNTIDNIKRTNIVKCGRFDFRFSFTSDDATAIPTPQIRLKKQSHAQTSPINIFFSRIRKVNGAGLRFNDNSRRSINTNKTISLQRTVDSINDGWVNIGTTNNNDNFTHNDQDEYFISYPGVENLYKVIVSTRTNSTASGITASYRYTIICEKF